MDLPNDIVTEVLSRFPLDRIGKVRALSKSHAKASYHSYYKDIAAERQPGPILDGFLLQSHLQSNAKLLSFVSPRRPNDDNNNSPPPLDLSLSFLPGRNPQIRAAAPNGLLLCETQHPTHYKKQIYTICKLSTKQWKGIPIPKTRFFTKNTAIFVLRSKPLHFKILRLSQDQIPSNRPLPFSYTICELFDSQSWRWKQLNDIVHGSFSDTVLSHCTPVFASGSAHWKFNDDISIFAFDFHSETRSVIPMPEPVILDYKDMRKNSSFTHWSTKLVEYEGKLGLMREFNEPFVSTELWVMENCQSKIWVKKCDLLGSMPMGFYGSDVSMTWLHTNKVMVSSLETGDCSYKEMEQTHRRARRTMIFPFVSDFEPWVFEPRPRTVKPQTMIKIIRKRLLAIQHNVSILVSFSFYFDLHNHYLCTILLGILNWALQKP